MGEQQRNILDREEDSNDKDHKKESPDNKYDPFEGHKKAGASPKARNTYTRVYPQTIWAAMSSQSPLLLSYNN